MSPEDQTQPAIESTVLTGGDVEDAVRKPDGESFAPADFTEGESTSEMPKAGAGVVSGSKEAFNDSGEVETVANPVSATHAAAMAEIKIPVKGNALADPQDRSSETSVHLCGLYDVMVNRARPLLGKKAIADYFAQNNVDTMAITQDIVPTDDEKNLWKVYRSSVPEAVSVSVHWFTAAHRMVGARYPYRAPNKLDLAALGQNTI